MKKNLTKFILAVSIEYNKALQQCKRRTTAYLALCTPMILVVILLAASLHNQPYLKVLQDRKRKRKCHIFNESGPLRRDMVPYCRKE